MSGWTRTPPPRVRVAIGLFLTVLPAGVVLTLINYLAYVRTRTILADLPATQNAMIAPQARRDFAVFVPHHILLMAAFFAVAALAFGAFGLAVLPRARRHPAAVPLLAGVLVSAFAIALFWWFENNPIVAFEGWQAGGFPEPWDMDRAAPGWYRPALASGLAVAGAVPLVAGLLLSHRESAAWVARRAADQPGSARRPGVMLLFTPVFAAGYGLVNMAAIAAAEYSHAENVRSVAANATEFNHLWVIALVVVTAPLATVGAAVLRRGPRSGALLASGLLTPLYLVVLWFTWQVHPLTEDINSDDQSGFLEHLPGWHWPLLTAVAAAAALHLMVNLLMLARGRFAVTPGRGGR